MLKLSDHAWRAHDMLIMWTLSNGTDGEFPSDVAEYAPKITKEALNELFQAGLVERQGEAWLLVRYAESQSSAEKVRASLENRRKSDRLRQARKRERDKEELEKQEKALGIHEEKSKQMNMSRDNNVTVGNKGVSNPMSRDNNVSVVMLNADDNKELEEPLKNETTQSGFNVSEDVQDFVWSGSFSDLPDDVDRVTEKVSPSPGKPLVCAEAGCEELSFGGKPWCFAHNQQHLKEAV